MQDPPKQKDPGLIRGLLAISGAGDRVRTDDLLVGNETFYQLNYARKGDVRPFLSKGTSACGLLYLTFEV
jgi:hypothetical protein